MSSVFLFYTFVIYQFRRVYEVLLNFTFFVRKFYSVLQAFELESFIQFYTFVS